jgi:hypothetical protein
MDVGQVLVSCLEPFRAEPQKFVSMSETHWVLLT